MLSVDESQPTRNPVDALPAARRDEIDEQARGALQPVGALGHITGPGTHTYVAHCNHYNCFLQKVLRSKASLNMDEVLVDTAAMLFFVTFVRAFDTDWSLRERLSYAQSYLRARGYGNPTVVDAADGEMITATASHHSSGYKAKFGVQDEPQDFFLTGAIQGALMAAFGCDVEVTQQDCIAMDDDQNTWTFTRYGGRQQRIDDYLRTAKQLQKGRASIEPAPKPDELPAPPVTSVVGNMQLIGDPEDGLIPAFNVYLTFIPSLYYNICSQVFLKRIQRNDMSSGLGTRLLKEAGHVCGFYTLGNILLSSEYELLRKAHFGAGADELDSMTTLFGVVNAFGWGYWTLDELSDDTLRFSVHNSYEAYNYREYFDAAEIPVCHLHTGGGEAIMNALRYGDILHFPGPIDRSYVDDVFQTSDGFHASEESCFAVKGNRQSCRVTVTR